MTYALYSVDKLDENPTLKTLCHRISAAIDAGSVEKTVQQVREALVSAIDGEELTLPEAATECCDGAYGRHLLFKCPQAKFSILVLTWSPGQGTPLHDHDEHWGVEAVFQGKIKVSNYKHLGTSDDGLERLELVESIVAGRGEAGHLIPPYEYHTIENALGNESSITIHVYSQELTECSVFEPVEENLYKRVKKDLSYDSDENQSGLPCE